MLLSPMHTFSLEMYMQEVMALDVREGIPAPRLA
jgi:hypothetical protein